LAQTPGLIVKSAAAARPVLDPNGDGYVSATNEGFSVNDETESEIPYVRLLLPNAEPTGDLATGPSCGFTDMVDNPSQYSSAYTYYSGGNWLFRFRIGNYATNSKGYSILIDTDGLFGNSGSTRDPNYVTGNPGFEVEIILVTNFGVRLNDIDGTTAPTLKALLAYNDVCQKSIALSTNCGTPDYFYDFGISFSVITTHFPSFTAATPVRLVANTVISTQSAIQAGPSDIAGVNDQLYGGNYDKAWTSVVDATLPTAPNNLAGGFPPIRSVAPVVNGPLAVGATSVSGTSAEANGTTIHVYVNNVSAGTATVSGGTWTATGIAALPLSATVYATATAPAESVSYASNTVTVGSTCSLVPSITCTSNKGIGGSGPASAPTGTVIRIYGPDNPATLLTTITTSATNTFLYNCAGGTTNCTGGGPNCITSGVYWVTAQEPGKCESLKTTTACVGTSGTANTPTIATNPILPSTTSITGTATGGTSAVLSINGVHTATTAVASNSYTFSGQTFALGQVVSVEVIQSTRCISTSATRTVTDNSVAPVVKSPIITGATSVSGTSIENQGATIAVYKNGVSVGTTTVDANGNWTLSGLAALAGGDPIRATATAAGEGVSALSNTVTVMARSAAPTVTGTYTEGGIAIGGTSGAALGTTITVYVDGVSVGTTIVAIGGWLLAVGTDVLYTNGVITATATESGKAESLPSAPVTIACSSPSAVLGINLFTPSVCLNRQASVQVLFSQSDVIYTLRDQANTVNRGTSGLGNGGTITLTSDRLTATQNFAIQAMKIPNTGCAVTLGTLAGVTVTQPTNTSGLASGDFYWTGSAVNTSWITDDNWVKWNGTAFVAVNTPPGSVDNVVIKPMESCITTQPSVTTTSSATLPAVARNLTIATGGTLVLENSASERALTLTGNWLNSGTFTPNGGTIKFAGNTTQTISNSNGPETFGVIAVEGASTLLQPLVDVSATGLILASGVLNLNGRKVTVTGSGTTAITRTAGLVRVESQNGSGELRWAIGSNTGADYVFPLGTAAGVYIPVTMRLTAGNIGTAGVSTVFANQALSANWPTGSEAVTAVATPAQAIRRYWHLASTQAAGSYTANVTFSFATAEDPTASISDLTTGGIKMQRWNGTSAWNPLLPGQVFTASQPARTVSVPGITQFSWWSGGNANNFPLPVEFLYFKGRYDAGQCVLTWATATETDCDKFIIERSADGIRYQDLASVPGAGNSLEEKTYTYADAGPTTGFNYYRIRQVDFNGDYAYTNVVALDVTGQHAFGVTAYPTPSKGATPTLSITASEQREVSIRIYDYLGYTHFIHTVTVGDTHEVNFEIPGFDRVPVGLYFIKVSSGGKDVLLKMVKN
jgi:hypothetical protein